VVVQFELGRMILSQMMTVYVPTLLIMTVSYLTTFFNNRQWFGHIITINLTVRFFSLFFKGKKYANGRLK
jgi:hypothetical protein